MSEESSKIVMDHTNEAVQAQLKSVLASSGFSEAKRLKDFLEYIVLETLAGRGDRISAYSVALDVFERDENFNPQTDTIVRVQAGHLRRRLEYYYLTEGVDAPVKILLLKGGYTPKFETRGGHKAPPQKTSKIFAEPRTQSNRVSIAVLPITNITPEILDDGFCVGLADEIVTRLTRFRSLLVTSKLNKKFSDEALEGIDACFVLDGIAQAGQQGTKISAHLTEVSTGTLLWGDSYRIDQDPMRFLEVQEDVASRIVARVAQADGVIAHHQLNKTNSSTSNELDVYHAVLCANHYLRVLTPEAHLTARAQLENALTKEPGDTEAWALLAWVYADEYRFGYNPKTDLESPLDRALEAAKKAVELDPENGTVWFSLFSTYFARKELAQFRSAGDKAIALNPDAPNILAEYGCNLCCTGDWDKGLPLVKKAISLNPDPPGWYYISQIISYYLNQQYDLALEKAQELENNGFFWNFIVVAMIYGQLGMTEEANKALCQLIKAKPDIANSIKEEWEKWNFKELPVQHFLAGLRKAGLEIR